jgi:hypothetical protein
MTLPVLFLETERAWIILDNSTAITIKEVLLESWILGKTTRASE